MSVSTDPEPNAQRRGLLAAVAAFGSWGVFPLFIALLAPAAPVEISAHRVVWTFAVCVIVIVATGTLPAFVALARHPALIGRLAVGAVFLAGNWLVFVIAVQFDRVVDASLGYFLNPLVSAGLAVLVLREKFRRAQWLALTIAAIGIVIMAVGLGTVPWIALLLATTFGLYGLTKKQVGSRVTAITGLGVETTVLFVPALVYLIVLTAKGTSTFGADVGVGGTTGHILLLIASGVISAVPLVLFAAASRRLPLGTVAMTQFITPVMQFLVGVVIMNEHMSAPRWIGFAFVWVALIVLTADLVRSLRKVQSPSAPQATPATAPERRA